MSSSESSDSSSSSSFSPYSSVSSSSSYSSDERDQDISEIFNSLDLIISNDQKLLFDGYIRLQILSLFHDTVAVMVSMDVINLCSKFFKLDMEHLLPGDNDKFRFDLQEFCDRLSSNNEYRVAYKITKALIKSRETSDRQNQLGILCSNWCDETMDEALQAYERAIELGPYDDTYRYNYGLALRDQGKIEQALTQLQQAALYDPDDRDYPRQCGNCCYEMKEYQYAKEYYLQAIELDAKDVETYSYYAIRFRNIREFELAIEQYKKGIEISVNNVEFYIGCGVCYRWLRDPENADKYFVRAVKIGKESARAHEAYASFLSRDLTEPLSSTDIIYTFCLLQPPPPHHQPTNYTFS